MWIGFIVFCGMQPIEMKCSASYAPVFFRSKEQCELAIDLQVQSNDALWERSGYPPVSFIKTGCEEVSKPA